MNLNFQDNGELIQKLAEKAAKLYCKVCGNLNEYDTALCDAYLFVVETDYNEERSTRERDQYIIRRVAGRLIDEYRKHNRKRNQEFDLDNTSSDEEDEETSKDLDVDDLIQLALNLCYPVTKTRTFLNDKERNLIKEYVALKKMDKKERPKSPLLFVAKKYGITQGRASQILKVVSKRYDLIRSGIRECVIIETRYENPTRSQIESTPLFYDF